jgi:hypothetical protein
MSSIRALTYVGHDLAGRLSSVQVPYLTVTPPSFRSLSRACTHPGTHVLRGDIAIIPVVGDALHPAIGYLLVVRQASKAKYVLSPCHPITPPNLTPAFSFLFFLFHAGFPKRSRGA